MLNLSKSYDFFQPEKVNDTIHVVGCGSVGSTVAENLVRSGLTKLVLWDFDKVESHNIVNQMFRQQDVGKKKVEALKEILVEINPAIAHSAVTKSDGWKNEIMSGIIILAVDNIELRKEIVEKHKFSMNVKAVFDVRTMLTGAQIYCCNWKELKQKEKFVSTMNFSHDEANAEVPTSACGMVLGVATTVRLASAYLTNNIISFFKGEGFYNFIQFDGFNGIHDFFKW